VDDNCNGQVDEGVELMFFRDADADGFGDPNNTTQACSVPTGYVTNNTDCNENNAAINPDAAEVCDGVDNNCNGQVDEGVNLTFYRDFDGDGFGDPNNTTQACTAPAGYVTNNTDCNDNNAAINPDAAEVCDGVDNNCNGQVDEGVNLTFFRDADADGFGDPNNTTQACSVPAGYVTNNSDCDDGNASINPNTVWYLDADNDNYHIGSGITECISPGPGYKISGLIAGGDCNDGNSTINPGATEACGNNLDDNCNDQINEGCPTTPTVSINDVTVYESQGQAILTVSLSGPSATPIKFNYKTIDGTAIKAKDYKNSNGNITIPAGNLSAQITIAIIQDNISEGEEFFDVRISLPKVTGQIQPAVIGDDLGEVTILDAVAPTLTKTAPRNINNNNLTKPESENLKISVMPNPSETDFILNIASGNSDPCYISVFDINGRLVKRIKSRSANIRFGRDLSSGVYIIEVEQKRNKKTLKAVKL